MESVNRVEFIGVVSGAPAIEVEGEATYAILTLATVERWKNGAGAIEEITETHEIHFDGQSALRISKLVKANALVYIDGKLTSQKFIDDAGVARVASIILGNSIKLLDRRTDLAPTAHVSAVSAQAGAKVVPTAPQPQVLVGASKAENHAAATSKPEQQAVRTPATVVNAATPAANSQAQASPPAPAPAAAPSPARKWSRGASRPAVTA